MHPLLRRHQHGRVSASNLQASVAEPRSHVMSVGILECQALHTRSGKYRLPYGMAMLRVEHKDLGRITANSKYLFYLHIQYGTLVSRGVRAESSQNQPSLTP